MKQMCLFCEWNDVTQLNSTIVMRSLDSNEVTRNANQMESHLIRVEFSHFDYVTSLNSQNTHKQVCEFSKHGSTILNKSELGTLVRIDFLPCKGCISKICQLAFKDLIAFCTYVSTLTVSKTP